MKLLCIGAIKRALFATATEGEQKPCTETHFGDSARTEGNVIVTSPTHNTAPVESAENQET